MHGLFLKTFDQAARLRAITGKAINQVSDLRGEHSNLRL
jgi:hypothetical protein